MIDLLRYPITVTGVLLFAHFALRRLRRSYGLPLPPGPKGYPIIGNLFEIGHRQQPWLVYSDIAKEYGDMFMLNSLGNHVLVLSSLRRCTELMEQRSTVYSDRPYLPMLCGQMKYADYFFAQAPYTPAWRRRRRLFHQHTNPTVKHKYYHIISGEAVQLLQDLENSPDRFRRHVQHYVNRVIFRVFYGLKIAEEDDPYILLGKWTMDGFVECSVPGTFLVDMIPALKYVPDWMPGTRWKRVAEHFRDIAHKAIQDPWDNVLENMKQGVAEPSVASKMIDDLSPVGSPSRADEEEDARDALGVGYIAGSDTTLAAVLTFVLLMAKYPEVQKKAQAEVDEVVGFGQIPSFDDFPKLVYIQAIIREVLRYVSMFRLGLPHATTEDDIYEGYVIPKGTIVVANIWHMANDPATYDNPSEFIPERHIKDGEIDKDVLDPSSLVFGFGRRYACLQSVCPGRHMAIDTLFMLFSSTLSSFDIDPPKDEAGNSTLKYSFNTNGAIVSPHPYECIIKPRSARHGEFIRAMDPSSKD
ncbi:hypothetical protein NMY22_g4464 [Coprinellus aureogranulatus]|nr:hypothetical protein NMY22_g4464 [Coprinellus aureogranulatus]